ncbi:hypothetical protein AZE42_07042 [Rhizopogon vesiculosus]|uniref:Protein kinase domain-containing protein n=1 Tax=Rhizopogon vesiculosus TaxID=180088 RepID=A0A1J8QLR0_9AGAM|nr:hypothetical protein AZE42_07042 [Rhizopogon vesiculosus]
MFHAYGTDFYAYDKMHIEGVEKVEPPVAAMTEKAYRHGLTPVPLHVYPILEIVFPYKLAAGTYPSISFKNASEVVNWPKSPSPLHNPPDISSTRWRQEYYGPTIRTRPKYLASSLPTMCPKVPGPPPFMSKIDLHSISKRLSLREVEIRVLVQLATHCRVCPSLQLPMSHAIAKYRIRIKPLLLDIDAVIVPNSMMGEDAKLAMERKTTLLVLLFLELKENFTLFLPDGMQLDLKVIKELVRNIRWAAAELFAIPEDDEEAGVAVSLSIECDTYSFGGIALQVLTCKVPHYNVKKDMVVLTQVISGKKPEPPRGPQIAPLHWEFIQ